MPPERLRPRSRQSPRAAACVLVLLLAVPILALVKLGRLVDWRIIVGYVFAISASTYLLYRHDKLRAEKAGQRTPEKTLHLLEMLGGWPAAFVAQRVIRHKIVKRNYQIAFVGIITAHELIAADFLQDWRFASQAAEQVLRRFL